MSAPVSKFVQIRAELQGLRADMNAAASIVKGGFDKMAASAAASNLAKQQATQAKMVQDKWTRAFAVIGIASAKMFKGMVRSLKDTVQVFAGFEQSLANTFSVVKDANTVASDLDDLEAAARRVGATTRSTASAAANALYFLASAGFSAKESIGALDGVNALAIATNSDLAKTSEVVATTIRQYGLEASGATDIANTFTAAITNSLATMDKLAKSFEYIGPIAAGLGLSVEETTGALQVLYNKGFSGEKAGRGLRSILTDLADSTSVVNRKLAALGINFSDINPAANDLADIMDNLRDNGVDATNAVSIFGKVSGVQLQALVSQASDAKGGIIEMTEAVTGTNRAFEAMEIQMDTLQGSFDKFKNAAESLKIGFGKSLSDPMRKVVDFGTEIIKGLETMPNPLKIVTIGLALFATGVLAVAAAIRVAASTLAGVTLAFGPLILGVAAVTAGVLGLGAAMVGVNTAVENARQDGFTKLQSKLGNVQEEMKLTNEQMIEFDNSLLSINGSFKRVDFSRINGKAQLTSFLTDLALYYNLSYLQVLKLAEANDDFAAKAGIHLANLLEDQELYNIALDLQNEKVESGRDAYEKSLAEAKLRVAEKEEADKYLETLEAVRLARKRAIQEKESLKGFTGYEEYSIASKIMEAFTKQLEFLIKEDLPASSTAIQDLRDVTSEALEGFEEFDDMSDLIKNFTEKLEDLNATELELIELERLRTLVTTKGNKDAMDAVNAYYDAVIEGAKEEARVNNFKEKKKEWDAYDKALTDYRNKLQEIGATELESIKHQRELALVGVATGSKLYEAIVEYFDALKEGLEDEQQWDKFVDNAEFAIEAISSIANLFSTIMSAVVDRQITELERLYEIETDIRDQALVDELARIERERLATLEAAGFKEETELERLQAEYDAAVAAGDATTAATAEDALNTYIINADYADKTAQAEIDATEAASKAEQDKADLLANLAYKQAMYEYGLNIINAVAGTANAIINAIDKGPIAITAASIIGGIQTAAVVAGIPERPPSFANGGIVPGSSYSGDRVPAYLNSGEVILNKAQQNNVAGGLSGKREIVLHNNLYLNSKLITKEVVRDIDNGIVPMRSLSRR